MGSESSSKVRPIQPPQCEPGTDGQNEETEGMKRLKEGTPGLILHSTDMFLSTVPADGCCLLSENSSAGHLIKKSSATLWCSGRRGLVYIHSCAVEVT